MKNLLVKFVFNHYRDDIYDCIVQEFIGSIPADVKEPALEFLKDRRVLFEKFLSIQAYNIQRARIYAKKSQEFYDGCLVIIRAFLAAVSKTKTQIDTVVVPKVDTQNDTKNAFDSIAEFRKIGTSN